MPQYRLVNPYIEGEFNSTYSAKSPLDAASETWENMSSFFSNNVPQMGFTLEDVNTNKLYNFVAKETPQKGGDFDYKISQLGKMDSKDEQAFRNKLYKFQNSKNNLQGGHRDCDDSTTDTENILYYPSLRYCAFQTCAQPILYWWYNPMIYRLNTLYIPSFISPLSPYVHLELTDLYLY